MMKIRNLTQGILHVPSMKLRIQGGAVASVPEITPAIQSLIDAGYVVVVTDEEAAVVAEAAAKDEAVRNETAPDPAAYEMLDENEAIEIVEDESDPKVIKSILKTENRAAVVDALKERLKETGNAGN